LKERTVELFEVFYNLIDNNHIHYFDESLLLLLTQYILKFSYLTTNMINKFNSNAKLSVNQIESQQKQQQSVLYSLNKKQFTEIDLCIKLIDKVMLYLTNKDSINHIVLCLCELLDLLNNSQQINGIDTLITQVYDVNIHFLFYFF
jgi:hypothetical protein